MSKETKQVNVYSTDGVVISSVDYTVPNDTKRDVLNALSKIRQNKNILSCQIDGNSVWSNIKLFDSTIDDQDRKEVQRGSFDDFTSDIQRLIIKCSGNVVLKAYCKWSDAFLTFEIE